MEALDFEDVSQDRFNSLKQRLLESGGELRHAEVPTGQEPTTYLFKGHGVESRFVYMHSKLVVEITKKPFFISLNHIKEGLEAGLGEKAKEVEMPLIVNVGIGVSDLLKVGDKPPAA